MNNIIWKNKYTIYNFDLDNNMCGEVIVNDHGGVDVKIYNSEHKEIKSEHFKKLNNAMKYIMTENFK